MKQFCAPIIVLLLFVSCNNQSKPSEEVTTPVAIDTKKWLELANLAYDYELHFPAGWEVERKPDDSNIMLKGTISESESFKSPGTFGIRVFTFDKEYTTDEAYKANIKNLSQDPVLDGFQIEGEDFIKLDGKDAARVIYAGGNGARRTVTLQYYIANGKRLYIMTGTLNGVDPVEAEAVYTKIAESVKFD